MVLDPAVVWLDSGMEFVHPLPLFLKKTGLSPHCILGSEAERKIRQKKERDGQAGVAGNTPLPQWPRGL